MAGWIGINSTHLHSHCGDTDANTLVNALDGATYWVHQTTETHQFILDLGTSIAITKVRSRSLTAYDPTEVNIYISDDTGSWGAAVVSGISTWKDTATWIEIAAVKSGRYVKVEITDTENISDYITFGPGAIFDVYGEAGAGGGAVSPLINSGFMNSLLLTGGLIG